MSHLQPCVRGDIGDTRTVQLAGVSDLSGVTAIEAHVWIAANRAATAATLTATVTDPVLRTITVQLGVDPATGWLPAVATAGEWSVEYDLTFGTTRLTFPNGPPDTITVRDSGDPPA